ncbi:hypothetical protein NDU88_006621 [Pleurodeles waltl]|uniref:Uncharacterized protein n=1 Tax=Pleurodeles waltl TaxID=8319 RepID=A0AAV7TXC4_PLEWA|nr:hypothetical protein NDU88_006621 [Pleurodeles waltl]
MGRGGAPVPAWRCVHGSRFAPAPEQLSSVAAALEGKVTGEAVAFRPRFGCGPFKNCNAVDVLQLEFPSGGMEEVSAQAALPFIAL